MIFCRQPVLALSFSLMAALIATEHVRGNPPAVAERISKESPDLIRRYGSSAYRQMPHQLAYSPDGRWMASREWDDAVHLIDAKTGETKLSYSLKNKSLIGFAFSSDSKSLAIFEDFTVTVWETAQGKLLRQSPRISKRDSGFADWFAISPDHEWRASVNHHREILVTKWDQVEPSHRIPFRSQPPLLAIGTGGEWVAAADPNSPVVRVWKAPKFETLLEWKDSESPVRAIASSRDGKTLYVGRRDGSLQAWNIEHGRDESQFLTEPGYILDLIVSHDGKLLVVATRTAAAIYETATGRALQKIEWGDDFPSLSVALSPDNTTLARGAANHPIELWDVKTGKVMYRQPPALQNVFATQDRRLFGSIQGFTISLWNRETGQLKENVPYPNQPKEGGFQGARVFHGTEQLVLGTSTGEALYRDLADQTSFESLGQMPQNFAWPRAYSGQGYAAHLLGPGTIQLNQYELARGFQRSDFRVNLKGSTAACLLLDFSEDGKTFAAAYADQSIFIWETQTGKPIQQFKLEATPKQILLSTDGRKLVVLYEDAVDVWDSKEGQQTHQLLDDTAQTPLVSLSYKDDLLATSIPGESIRIWSLETGKEISTLDATMDPLESLAFSRDDKQLAVAIEDKTIRLIDLKTKKETLKMKGHRGAISHLLFRPDGERLVSVSTTADLYLWDTVAGKPIQSRRSAPAKVGQFVMAEDGKSVLLAHKSSHLFRFPIDRNAGGMMGTTGLGNAWPRDFAYHKESQRLAVVNDFGIRVLDRKAGRELPFVMENRVTRVEWGPEGQVLMAVSSDLLGWDVEEQKEVYRIPAEQLKGTVRSMARSPNGQIVAVGISNGRVMLWDPKTGRLIREIRSPSQRIIQALQFSPDGRLLFALAFDMYFITEVESGLVWYQKPIAPRTETSFAQMGHHTLLSAETQGTARLWSWAATVRLDEERSPEILWESLAKPDGPAVYQTMFALAEWNDETVEFLSRHLPRIKTPAASPEEVASLIRNLEESSPSVRRKASEELRELGKVAHPHLEAALKNENLSRRVRTRIQFLLAAQGPKVPSRLSMLRAIQLLEWIATPKAKELLREFAGSTDPIGIEAQAAWDRLQ